MGSFPKNYNCFIRQKQFHRHSLIYTPTMYIHIVRHFWQGGWDFFILLPVSIYINYNFNIAQTADLMGDHLWLTETLSHTQQQPSFLPKLQVPVLSFVLTTYFIKIIHKPKPHTEYLLSISIICNNQRPHFPPDPLPWVLQLFLCCSWSPSVPRKVPQYLPDKCVKRTG